LFHEEAKEGGDEEAGEEEAGQSSVQQGTSAERADIQERLEGAWCCQRTIPEKGGDIRSWTGSLGQFEKIQATWLGRVLDDELSDECRKQFRWKTRKMKKSWKKSENLYATSLHEYTV